MQTLFLYSRFTQICDNGEPSKIEQIWVQINNDSQLAVLYLAVEVELVDVLAEPDLGVVDGLKEAELDQDLGLVLLCKVTKI